MEEGFWGIWATSQLSNSARTSSWIYKDALFSRQTLLSWLWWSPVVREHVFPLPPLCHQSHNRLPAAAPHWLLASRGQPEITCSWRLVFGWCSVIMLLFWFHSLAIPFFWLLVEFATHGTEEIGLDKSIVCWNSQVIIYLFVCIVTMSTYLSPHYFIFRLHEVLVEDDGMDSLLLDIDHRYVKVFVNQYINIFCL